MMISAVQVFGYNIIVSIYFFTSSSSEALIISGAFVFGDCSCIVVRCSSEISTSKRNGRYITLLFLRYRICRGSWWVEMRFIVLYY